VDNNKKSRYYSIFLDGRRKRKGDNFFTAFLLKMWIMWIKSVNNYREIDINNEILNFGRHFNGFNDRID